MRPHLKEYYEDAYEPLRERIAGMKEAEANGQAPKTITTKDGEVVTELSAAQYESAIPSFDKWLDMQQNFSVFDLAEQSNSVVNRVQDAYERVEQDLSPDQPSNVKTVFSDGNKILAYINQDGSLVTHEGGSALQKIAKQADKLNLTGAAKTAYLQKHGAAELSHRYANLQVITYDHENIPTRREFSETWYPHHDVDAAYENALKEFKDSLEQRQAWQTQQEQNLNNFRNALLKIIEDAQSTPSV